MNKEKDLRGTHIEIEEQTAEQESGELTGSRTILIQISVIIASPNGHRGAAIQAALTKAATHKTEAMLSSVSKTKTTGRRCQPSPRL